MIHHINLGIHVATGCIAIIIGLLAIMYNRQVIVHKKLGGYFVYLLMVVIATAFLGFFFFRNNPFLLMLTLLSMYVGCAGFRNIQLKEKRSTRLDALLAFVVLSAGIGYVWLLSSNQNQWDKAVVIPTMVALVVVTAYDLAKHFFFHAYIKKWWLYEHIYKMISAFSALVSAFTGNVLKDFHPYSQIGPSAFCTLLIIYFIIIKAKANKKTDLAKEKV